MKELAVYDTTAMLRTTIDGMRGIAIRALRRMYLPNRKMFCWCIRRGVEGDRVEGESRRYTAITLTGLAAQQNNVDEQIFTDATSHDVCGRLLSDVDEVTNMGDVSLTLWAAGMLGHGEAKKALNRLRTLDPVNGQHPTVEVAWALTAMSIAPEVVSDTRLADAIAERLLNSYSEKASLFPHWPKGAAPSGLRAHVTCFADWVYPVQALSHYHRLTGNARAIETARAAAKRMCNELQGPAGQWWWHFDARTGQIVEGYPVYSVHQDSMAPMALFDLQDACGDDHTGAIDKGLEWLVKSPERGDSLIDREADVIWRKVCRAEPGKLTRGLQASASRIVPSMRVPGVDTVFPPKSVDYETRPYHMGWILYAFSDRRLKWYSEG